MESAAERFYVKSHQAQKNANSESPTKSVDQILQELRRPRHRYFCTSQYLSENRGLSVVELGFGSADIARALASCCEQYRIVDVVPRHEGINLPSNVSFTKADLNDDFPFSDGEFACTIAMMVVEHLFDPFHSFREIARITKRGGKIFINLPNIGSIRCRLQLARGQMPITSNRDWFSKEEWDGNHLHYFTLRDTLRLGERTGLKFDGFFPVGNMRWIKRLRPQLFCGEISFAFTKI